MLGPRTAQTQSPTFSMENHRLAILNRRNAHPLLLPSHRVQPSESMLASFLLSEFFRRKAGARTYVHKF